MKSRGGVERGDECKSASTEREAGPVDKKGGREKD